LKNIQSFFFGYRVYGEGAGAAAQDCIGAIVERLKGWDQAAPMDPDEGGGE
jgi:hypothetical protein